MTLFWLSSAWLAGIAIDNPAGLTSAEWASLSLLGLAATFLFRNRRFHRWLFVIFFTICLGAWRAQLAQPILDDAHISRFNDFTRPIRLTGIVVGPPDVRDGYVGLRVQAESIRTGEDEPRTAHGQVLVQAERYLHWAYGDRIQAVGYLRTPPEDETFSYREYLARQGTFSVLRSRTTERLQTDLGNPALASLYRLRQAFHSTVRNIFPEPEASLLSGILLGIESGISPQVREAFNATGTTHIIAISGFNITIIAGLFITFFGKVFGTRRGVLAAGCGILVYTLLVGADPAVVRAAIMGGLSLVALRLGRRTHALASLGAAGVAMTAIHPATLFDVGFQLSFAATLGMILYAQPLQDAFEGWLSSRWTLAPARVGTLAGPVGEYFLFTLAAQVTTLPLTVFYFHRLSLASLVANPAILPAQPAVMVLAGLATLAGTVWLGAGHALAVVAWPFAAYTIRTVTWFANLPLANLGIGWINPIWVAGFYGLLFAMTAARRLPSLPQPRWPSIPAAAGITALAVGVFVAWDGIAQQPDGRLHLITLDTHGGQAVLVVTPSGRAALINGGMSPIALENQLGSRLAPFDRSLDWLVIASSREPDLLGLADLTDRFEVRAVLADESAGDGPAWAIVRSLHENGTPFSNLQTAAGLALGDGARLWIIGADHGDGSVGVAMKRAGFAILSGPEIELMAASSTRLDLGGAPVIILSQSSEITPAGAQWLMAWSPLAVVVSCDSADPNSLPSPALEQTLGSARLLRTDQLGDVELTTDGVYLWVSSQRQVRSPPGDQDPS